MSCEYYPLKKPLTHIHSEIVGTHVHTQLFANHARIGELTLENNCEWLEFLQIIFDFNMPLPPFALIGEEIAKVV